MLNESYKDMERDSLVEKWCLTIYTASQQPREETFLAPAGDLKSALKMADEYVTPYIKNQIKHGTVVPSAVLSRGSLELARELTPKGAWKDLDQDLRKTLGLAQTSRPVQEINQEDERLILDAANLLKNPRSLDNSEFRGREISAQENETLDLIVQVKKHLESDKVAMAKLKTAGVSLHGIGKKNIGKKGVGPLREFEVIARTQLSAVLLRGRRLYIYNLKLMELQPPATGLKQGDLVNLIWPYHREMAKVRINQQGLELKQTRGKAQTQSMEGM